ncbi:heavy metal-binding domain-containing protein [uncultured Roseobacter sp.]|nr:heavy metal-binding domain-containing protein [uncultured Roseobacter sp.]
MILIAANTVAGRPITAYKRIVVGEAIIGASIARDFFATTSVERSVR